MSDASPPVDGADRLRGRREIALDVSALKATGADGTQLDRRSAAQENRCYESGVDLAHGAHCGALFVDDARRLLITLSHHLTGYNHLTTSRLFNRNGLPYATAFSPCPLPSSVACTIDWYAFPSRRSRECLKHRNCLRSSLVTQRRIASTASLFAEKCNGRQHAFERRASFTFWKGEIKEAVEDRRVYPLKIFSITFRLWKDAIEIKNAIQKQAPGHTVK